jgi:hypothetical protein
MADLNTEIRRAREFRARVGAITAGEYSNDRRTTLLVGFADQIFEHHEAILFLIEHHLAGSAFALVRSLIEAFFKVHWAVACATDADVEKIATKKRFEFPGADDMVKQIDEKLKTDGYFLEFKKNAWPALNSYTHTGLLQLSRRFTGQRAEPEYREGECIEVVHVITTSIVLLGRFFTVSTDRLAEAEQAEKLMEEYAAS